MDSISLVCSVGCLQITTSSLSRRQSCPLYLSIEPVSPCELREAAIYTWFRFTIGLLSHVSAHPRVRPLFLCKIAYPVALRLTTRRYYIGNDGLSLFNFAPTAFQNLLYQQSGDSGYLYFAGSNRTINSIVLLCNGISFAIQIVVFLILGSYADFGTWRPNILIVLSFLAWGIGFGWLGVHEAQDWKIGAGMYIVGLIAYQTTLTFWTAAFPGLARNTPEMRATAIEYQEGRIDRDAYDFADSMKRNELSNMAFIVQSVAEIVILAIIVGIMFGLDVRASTENNNWGLSVLIAFVSGVWLLLAIPWFIWEKRRPGQDPGMNIVLAGFWQLRRAMMQVWKLKQSFFYLIGEWTKTY
jgi:MFS-type transporter involved in bile tolerance (Atg22 family)